MLATQYMASNTKAAGSARPLEKPYVIAVALLLVALPGCIKQKGIRWRAPAFASGWNLRVGSGAEYRATCSWGEQSNVQLAIVGKEPVDVHQGYWMEASSHSSSSATQFVAKALFYENAKGMMVFTRVIVLVPGHAPMELPDKWTFSWTRGLFALAAGYIEPYQGPVYSSDGPLVILGPGYPVGYFTEMTQFPAEIPRAKPQGPEQVVTPAGKFDTQHWRVGSPVDVWLAKEAGPFGLVRARLKDSRETKGTMTLTRVLGNATDKIWAPAERADADKLWQWLRQERQSPSFLCLPQVGMPLLGLRKAPACKAAIC